MGFKILKWLFNIVIIGGGIVGFIIVFFFYYFCFLGLIEINIYE